MEFYMPTQIYHEAEAVRKHGEEWHIPVESVDQYMAIFF